MSFHKDLGETICVLETNCKMYGPQNVKPTKQFFSFHFRDFLALEKLH